MNNYNGNQMTIEESFAPLSRVIAKTFFGEKYERTLSQKIEDEQGISKERFHELLIGVGVLFLISKVKD